jgi:hypothetical protein
MKTTIDIADPILHRAKRLAARRHTTLRAVVESALRDALEAENHPRKPCRVETHVVEGKGLQPGLDWDDWSRILELCYEGRGG